MWCQCSEGCQLFDIKQDLNSNKRQSAMRTAQGAKSQAMAKRCLGRQKPAVLQ